MNETGDAGETVNAGPVLEPCGDPAVDAILTRLADTVADLNSLDLTALVRLDRPSTGLHAVARNVEAIRRCTQVFDSKYVAAVEVGGEPARYAQPTTAVFLREQLRLTKGEARRRVDLAHAITPTIAFTGEVLPAPLPVLAAAVTAGVVSGEQARTIIETIHRLPTTVRAESGPVVEAEMVHAAGKVTPADLDGLAVDVLVRADPDGVLRDIGYAHQNRGLHLSKNRGRPGGKLTADLDAEAYEYAKTVIDAVSKPAPAVPASYPAASPGNPASNTSNPASNLAGDLAGDPASDPGSDPGCDSASDPGSRPCSGGGIAASAADLAWATTGADVDAGAAPLGQLAEVLGTRDDRTLAERQHDGFVDVLKFVLAAGDLPASGGTAAAVVWHVTDVQLRDRYGLAVSEHGTLLPVGDALRTADQTHLYLLIKNSKGVPLHLARTSRIATPGQTIALAARDRGCSFPGCDRPPSHCERHHVTDWSHGGPTDIGNLTLLCGHHHRTFHTAGWECLMLNGIPHWRPPAWLDPHRTPIRNTRHFTLPETG